MTEQEAIKKLSIFDFEKMSISGNAKHVADFLTACDMGAKALEKQIPKKLQTKGYFKVCECGCEMSTFLMYNRANYCPNCGQKIDFVLEKEEKNYE